MNMPKTKLTPDLIAMACDVLADGCESPAAQERLEALQRGLNELIAKYEEEFEDALDAAMDVCG